MPKESSRKSAPAKKAAKSKSSTKKPAPQKTAQKSPKKAAKTKTKSTAAKRVARSPRGSGGGKTAELYRHTEAENMLRPEVGTQSQFRKKKPPQKYRYDDSLAPSMEWDGENWARSYGEWLLKLIQEAAQLPAPHTFPEPRELKTPSGEVYATVGSLNEAIDQLKAIEKPFLNWSGKAENHEINVPTLPLFVHERLSTKAIIETLQGHKREQTIDLFGGNEYSTTDRILGAYEYTEKWENRMILGDSLQVMNSLLRYEPTVAGQVQMIYMDPPYGVKFGSNFQPYVRKRDVTHNDDDDMTREPEMVKAYRDTWELGLHSYLTYMRDRLKVARDLLKPEGSIFVQISDENVHHVRELMDEVFGKENFVSQVVFQTTGGFATTTISTLGDFLLWYAKDPKRLRVRKIYSTRELVLGEGNARWVLLPDGSYRGLKRSEIRGEQSLPEGARLYKPQGLQSQGKSSEPQPFTYENKTYHPRADSHWKANYPDGMQRLANSGRIHVAENSLQYRRFADDFPFIEIGNIWTDTMTGSFTDDKVFAVQTNTKVIERCLLLVSDPGDLILDPTCGSGTTAYVAEQWGRRWITCDVSRVPLALARQRLLTAKFDYYALNDMSRGPASGFVYTRRQNSKGEDIGGIVPHVTLKSIAKNAPPEEEVLVDRPESIGGAIRVSGPFVFEATIPSPVDFDNDGREDSGSEDAMNHIDYVERMIEILRQSPVISIGGNKTVTLAKVRPPAKSMVLSAEAIVKNGDEKRVAIVFGPENGHVSEKLVFEAAKEANAKGHTALFVVGAGFQANAQVAIANSAEAFGLPAYRVDVTRDVGMGDLLKNQRSSQIFSTVALPDAAVRKVENSTKGEPQKFEVELLGLDSFDPITMNSTSTKGKDVPAWFLDTDYNGTVFHVSQAFFPRTGAWENLKKALGKTYEDAVWDHLSGTISAPFEAGEHDEVAVKVIDERGNELMRVLKLKDAK